MGNPYIQTILIPEGFLKKSKQTLGMCLADSIPITEYRKC